jgi:hypothetical protein
MAARTLPAGLDDKQMVKKPISVLRHRFERGISLSRIR